MNSINDPHERPEAEDTVAAHDSLQGDRRRTVLGVIVVAIVIAAAGLAVYQKRHAFASALHRVGVASMLASLAVGALSTAVTFPVWRGVLHGLGVEMPWGVGVRVFFTSQLGKYLPGSVWPVLIQMEAGRTRGASRRTMLAANLVTIVLSCAVGLTVASVILPFTDSRALSRYWWLLVALPFLLALLHPRAVPMVLDRAFALIRREPLGERLPVRDSLRASAWSLASFAAQGLHIAILVLAIAGGGFSTVLLATGGMALAVSAGVLFIPAPAGAGIRDVLLTLVLSTVLTSGEALVVVVASRVILIVGDLTLAAAAVISERIVRARQRRVTAA